MAAFGWLISKNGTCDGVGAKEREQDHAPIVLFWECEIQVLVNQSILLSSLDFVAYANIAKQPSRAFYFSFHLFPLKGDIHFFISFLRKLKSVGDHVHGWTSFHGPCGVNLAYIPNHN